jgi:hypothetical protein
LKLLPFFLCLLLAGTPSFCPSLHGSNLLVAGLYSRIFFLPQPPDILDSLPDADEIIRRGRYPMWLHIVNSRERREGYLFQVKDSSVIVFLKDPENWRAGLQPSEMPVSSLDELRFRRKGKSLRGAAIGAGAGIFLGHFLIGDDCKNYAGCIDLAYPFRHIIGGAGGMLVGALIGSVTTKIPIRGNLNNFEARRARLKKYSVD